MSFDSSTITEVYPPQFKAGQMVLRWRSSAPADTWYQVYVGGVFVDRTQSLTLAIDPPDGHVHVDIGTVADGEQDTDFSGSLSPILNRARLTWTGGPGLAADLAGFRIYGESVAGGGINYGSILVSIPAVEQGIRTDGFGLGGFGAGGFGSGSGNYTWTSGTLTRGTWNFAVRTYDNAGNEANGLTTSVAITTPPRPPALDTGGKRLTCTYSQSTKQITLNWLASPG